MGNNEIFQLLQSAYSGAPAGVGVVDKTSTFDISMVNLVGARRVLYHQEPEKEEANLTQLDAIVDYIADYCEENKIANLPPICLPALEEVIPYKKYDKADNETENDKKNGNGMINFTLLDHIGHAIPNCQIASDTLGVCNWGVCVGVCDTPPRSAKSFNL